MFATILDFLRSLPPAAVIGLAFLMPAAETGLVFGFVLPGELAVVTAGVLAAHSRVPLAWIIAAAVVGSIVGDSVGYFVGRRFRVSIKKRLPIRRWKRAEDLLHRSGPVAVFLARFTAFARSLMPPVAGAARLPYAKFLPWSLAAGLLWGSGSVLLGYFFARNAEKILHWSIGVVALLAILAGGGAYLVTRHRTVRRRRAHARSG